MGSVEKKNANIIYNIQTGIKQIEHKNFVFCFHCDLSRGIFWRPYIRRIKKNGSVQDLL